MPARCAWRALEAITVVLLVGATLMWNSSPRVVGTEIAASSSADASYTIFIDSDGRIKARNEVTGEIDYSSADAAAVFQRSVDVLSSTGGLIILKSGTYVWQSTPALPRNLPNWLKIIGEGVVTIQLTANGPRAFDFNKKADYDTFQNIWIENLIVDCNNVGGSHHVVLGTYVNDAITTRININNIVIRNIKTINVPVDPTMTNHRLNVYLVVAHPATGETQTSITDVLVENCDFRGGNQGVVIGGHGPPAVNLKVFLDRIYIRNVRHSLLSVQSTFFYSANFHVGDGAYGGYVHIVDCYGEYSGDVGVEINNLNALVENVVIRDAYENMFYHTNYNNLLSPNEQLVTFKNCVVRRVSLPSTSSMDGFVFGRNNSNGLGSVILDNCEYYGTGGEGINCALLFYPTNGFQRLDVRGFKVSDQISRTSLTDNYVSLAIVPSGGTIRGTVSLRGVDVATAGSKSGGTMNYLIPVYLAGVMDVEIDGLTIDVNVTGVAADTVRGIRLGAESGSSIAGAIRGLSIKQITTDTNPAGIGIAGTGSLTIPTELRIENCDFSAMTGGTEVAFGIPSNADKIYLHNNLWIGNGPTTTTSSTTSSFTTTSTTSSSMTTTSSTAWTNRTFTSSSSSERSNTTTTIVLPHTSYQMTTITQVSGSVSTTRTSRTTSYASSTSLSTAVFTTTRTSTYVATELSKTGAMTIAKTLTAAVTSGNTVHIDVLVQNTIVEQFLQVVSSVINAWASEFTKIVRNIFVIETVKDTVIIVQPSFPLTTATSNTTSLTTTSSTSTGFGTTSVFSYDWSTVTITTASSSTSYLTTTRTQSSGSVPTTYTTRETLRSTTTYPLTTTLTSTGTQTYTSAELSKTGIVTIVQTSTLAVTSGNTIYENVLFQHTFIEQFLSRIVSTVVDWLTELTQIIHNVLVTETVRDTIVKVEPTTYSSTTTLATSPTTLISSTSTITTSTTSSSTTVMSSTSSISTSRSATTTVATSSSTSYQATTSTQGTGGKGVPRFALDASPKPGYVGKPVTISGVMYGSWRCIRNGVVVSKSVEIATGWSFKTTIAVSADGRFSVAATGPLTGGSYTVSAIFYEDEDLAGASATVTYQVVQYVETVLSLGHRSVADNSGNGRLFSGYLKEKNGGKPVASKTIKLTIVSGGNAMTFTVQTDSQGYYEYMFTGNGGIFTSATASFAGDNTYLPSTAKVAG